MSLPAPDWESLLDFEGNFETAAAAVLEASPWNIASFISQQNGQLPIIGGRADVTFDAGPALAEYKTNLAKPAGWPADLAPPQEYYRYTGVLMIQIAVARDDETPVNPVDVATLFRAFRGKVRTAFMRVFNPFDSKNLPYYKVTDIQPAGSMTTFDQAINLDFCALRFTVYYDIRDDAWPAWTTP